MADQYTASMFGLDSPYWRDKFGWDFQRDERYPEKLDDLQENRLLAEGLNMAGITPDMDLGDIRKKYKSEFKDISNEEIHSFLDNVFTKAGIDTGFTYGDANSMFRKFLNFQGILREPDKKDWPTIDIPYWRDPVASIDPKVWDEKMRRDGDVVETIEWETPGAVRKMANGGLINGTRGDPGMAVVGENGPELVEVNEGQAKVTPLPDQLSWITGSGAHSPDFPWKYSPIDEFSDYFGVSQRYGPTPKDAYLPELDTPWWGVKTTASGHELYPTGDTYNLEDTTIKKMPDGKKPPYGDYALLQGKPREAYLKLQRKFFDKYGFNFKLSSAYRNEDHNTAVGGLEGGSHPEGNAFDVRFKLLSKKMEDDLKKWGPSFGLHYAKGTHSHFNYK